MKVVYTSDLHGIKGLYKDLQKLIEELHPDVLIVGGDLLPKDAPPSVSIEDQARFITGFLEKWLYGLKEISKELRVYTMLGNDDWLVNMPLMKDLEEKGLCKLLHMTTHHLGSGVKILGYGNCPPTPFSNKDSERIDIPSAPKESQFYAACISTDKGLKKIDAEKYFKSMPSIEQELEMLPDITDYRQTVFVSHAPPYNSGLDTLYDGRPIGSLAIRQFIEEKQPLLSLHGHIHEAPSISGRYVSKIGETICINPGQSVERLHAVVFNLQDIKGSMWHTIYGYLSKNL